MSLLQVPLIMEMKVQSIKFNVICMFVTSSLVSLEVILRVSTSHVHACVVCKWRLELVINYELYCWGGFTFCELTYLCNPSTSSPRFKTGGINWRLGPRLKQNTNVTDED